MDVDEDDTIHGAHQLPSQPSYASLKGFEIAECIGTGGFSK